MFVWSRQAIGKIQTRGPTPYTYIPYTTLFRSRSLQESGITATFFASYVPPFYTNRGAADFARKLIDLILFETKRKPLELSPCTDSAGIRAAKAAGRIAVMIGV